MKNNARASWITGAVIVGLLAASATAQETVVYDNSANPLNQYFASTREFGDQITIGSGWLASSFRFEYFASGLSGGEVATIQFYENDGLPLEGTDTQIPAGLLYQSPEIPLQNGNVPVLIEQLAPHLIALPESFTWTIRLKGVTGSEVFGLVLYDPPVTGSSQNDIWQFTTEGWQLIQLPGLPPGASANFGAYLTAVPEPSTMALLALGGFALFLRRRVAGR